MVKIINRRNSIVYLVNKNYVIKKYNYKFSIHEEIQQYNKLTELVSNHSIFNIPRIYYSNEKYNFFRFEYIDGSRLDKIFNNSKIIILEKLKEEFLRFFARSADKGYQFDLDPSNLIMKNIGYIYIIDPICEKIDIEHHSIIVFTFGLIKLYLKNIYKINPVKFFRIWNSYYDGYIQYRNLKASELNNEMEIYIDKVIYWNTFENFNSSIFNGIIRKLIYVPIYIIIKYIFKYNLLGL